MIDHFSKSDFDAALAEIKGTWESMGLLDGEYAYSALVSGTNKRIVVRSSVGANGVSADTGEDSIRVWLQYSYRGRWAPMTKVGKWVTRVAGWELRLSDTVDKLWDLAVEDTNKHKAKYGGGKKTQPDATEAKIEKRSDAPRCVECGTPMELLHGRFGKFWGCPGFPACRYTTKYFERVPETVSLPDETPKALPHKFEFSDEQTAIFDFIEHQSGHLVVEAKAGSGKTFTLKHAALRIDPEKQVLAVAFNTHIAKALREALKDHPQAHVSTLHSKGYSDIGAAFGGKPRLDEKKLYTILKELVVKNMPPKSARRKAIDANASLVVKMVNLLKDTLLPPTRESLDYLTDRFSVTPDGIGIYPFYAVVRLVFWLSLRNLKTVDYGDMVYLPASGIVASAYKYDFVLGDEAQDYNAGQIELVMKSIKPGGRVVVFGDRYQCQPAGTLVYKTGVGYVPIETVQVGDELLTYLDGYFPGKDKQGRKVAATAFREYQGDLVHLKAGEYEHDVTPEHRCFVRMIRRNGWAVYLLRRGDQVRVGMTKSANNPAGSVAMRGRQEKADCGWILGIFDNYADASLLENQVSYQYGIPQICFQRKWEVKENTTRIQDWLDRFWDTFTTSGDRLSECLETYGRDVRYPFWTRGKNGGESGSKCGSLYTFVTQACNLVSGWMRVCTFSGSQAVRSEDWQEVEVSRQSYAGMVYSLELEERWRGHPLYVAQGIVTHNSIYGFRGADTDAIPNIINRLQAETLPLNTCYRCGYNIIGEAQKFVPEIRAAAWAEPGEVINIGEADFLDLVRGGDRVLCRVNAPLVPVCYALIRRGIPAIIRGRDICSGLKKLLGNVVDKYRVRDIDGLMTAIVDYRDSQVMKLLAADRGSQAQAIKDQADTLIELAMDVEQPSDIIEKIDVLFTDTPQDGFVVLSTVHRAKGDEADNVYALRPDLFPHPMATKPWERDQELNIQYVLATRAKKCLGYVQPRGVRVDAVH